MYFIFILPNYNDIIWLIGNHALSVIKKFIQAKTYTVWITANKTTFYSQFQLFARLIKSCCAVIFLMVFQGLKFVLLMINDLQHVQHFDGAILHTMKYKCHLKLKTWLDMTIGILVGWGERNFYSNMFYKIKIDCL